jgi:hypothetical protein
MIARFLLSATLAVALLHSAWAATLAPNDNTQALELGSQLLQLDRDVLNSAKVSTSRSYECLTNIKAELDETYGNLTAITDLVGLSVDMQAATDERAVNKLMVDRLRLARRLLTNSRASVNVTAGFCGDDGNVIEKTRQALGIFSRLDGVYAMLQSRLGAAQR